MKSQSLKNKQYNLIADNENWDEITLNKADAELYRIGFWEVVPIIAGILLSGYIRPFLFPDGYTVIGIIISLIVAYQFRNDVPDQPISLRH
jgi:hypothetical protein